MNYVKERIENYFPSWLIKAVNKKGGFFVSGGAITSLVTRKEINDLDLYFVNKESLCEFIRCAREEGWWCSFVSEKSINYVNKDGDKLQCIYYDYFDSPEDIWKDYDFTINMSSWSSVTGEMSYHEDFFLHNSQRYLSFNPNTKFAWISALRVQKYKERGYYIPKNQFLKIIITCSQVEVNSWEDFKSHCGQLYGLNYLSDDMLKGREFSIENALDLIDNVSFEGNSLQEFKIDPRIVDVVLEGKPVEYVEFNGKVKCVQDLDDYGMIEDLINTGNIQSKEVDLKGYIGEYVYKWVDENLCSHYTPSFKYTVGEEVVAKRNMGLFGCGGYNKPVMWFLREEDVLTHGTYRGRGVILKCKYCVEDVVDLQDTDILLNKVVPVEVITQKEFESKHQNI